MFCSTCRGYILRYLGEGEGEPSSELLCVMPICFVIFKSRTNWFVLCTLIEKLLIRATVV